MSKFCVMVFDLVTFFLDLVTNFVTFNFDLVTSFFDIHYYNITAHPTNPVEGCADANPKTVLPNDT